ncbi:MAG: hypothetical protein HY000_39080 [Planctomycetes bacterium]|nr:hypothetical protein [Planctomycetota bacterium]
MAAFLTNHEKFVEEYSTDAPPLIVDTPERLDIRWAGRGAEFGKAASRHHDHWLACLLEGGVDLNQVVHSPRRDLPLREWLLSAVHDFRLDEQEYEWSSMAFAYTLAPGQCWSNDQSRQLSFELIAKRLLRGDDKLGVCHGTHRLYALAVLARLSEESPVLCPQVYAQVRERLHQASETLVAAQEESGCWNQRWSEGSRAIDGKDASTLVDKVLVTGHHLEWLSITPQDWLPPHDRLVRSGQWLVRAVHESSEQTIAENYTFYSHVVGALSNWRSVKPSHFLCLNAPASTF